MRVLGALIALLFAGGVVGVATVTGDDEESEVDIAVESTTTFVSDTIPATTSVTTTLPPTTSVTAAGTTSPVTSVPSGLGTGGSATVQGSEQMADTGSEDWLLPGLALLGVALGGRRLRLRSDTR